MPTDAPSSGAASGAPGSPLSVACTQSGYCLRVTGRGTSQSSPAAQAFANQVMTDAATTLVVDLSRCDYLDSTFLGFLVSLHRTYGKRQEGNSPRFTLVATPERWTKLLAPTGLQRLFNAADTIGPIRGEWLPLTAPTGNARDWAEHVLECHRQLADIDGPSRERFARITQQLAADLERQRTKPPVDATH
jgi:anti-anti-sigma factor